MTKIDKQIIEFIGPTSVGKSTLAGAIAKKLPENWIIKKQAAELIESYSVDESNLSEADRNLITALITAKAENIFESTYSTDENQLIMMNFYYSEIILDFLIKARIEQNVFMDDGVSQDFSTELLRINNDEVLDQFFDRRCLVYLQADAQTVLKNTKERKSDATQDWYNFFQPNEEMYMKQIAEIIETKEQLCALAEKHGATVIRLNANDSLEDNVAKINIA